MVGQTTRSPWTLLFLYPWSTGWRCYFYNLKQFQTLTFFDIRPLNRRFDDEVHVNTFACLSMLNLLTLLFLSFEIISNFDLLWTVTPHRGHFWMSVHSQQVDIVAFAIWMVLLLLTLMMGVSKMTTWKTKTLKYLVSVIKNWFWDICNLINNIFE